MNIIKKAAKKAKDLGDKTKNLSEDVSQKSWKGLKSSTSEIKNLSEDVSQKSWKGLKTAVNESKDFLEDAGEKTLEGLKTSANEPRTFGKDVWAGLQEVARGLKELSVDAAVQVRSKELEVDPAPEAGPSFSPQDPQDPRLQSLTTTPFDQSRRHWELMERGVFLWIPRRERCSEAGSTCSTTAHSDLAGRAFNAGRADLTQSFEVAEHEGRTGPEHVERESDSTCENRSCVSSSEATALVSNEDKLCAALCVDVTPATFERFAAEHSDKIQNLLDNLCNEESFDATAAAVLRVLLMQTKHPVGIPSGPVIITLAVHHPVVLLGFEGEPDAGPPLQIFNFCASRNQKWRIDGGYICLDASAWRLGVAAEGGEVKLENSENGAAFVFEDGRIKLASNRQLCLDVQGSYSAEGAKVQLLPVKRDDDDSRCSQLWIFTAG